MTLPIVLPAAHVSNGCLARNPPDVTQSREATRASWERTRLQAPQPRLSGARRYQYSYSVRGSVLRLSPAQEIWTGRLLPQSTSS
jgi:hypothetical protein